MDLFQEIKNDVRSILLPMLGQEIPLAVMETIEALWEEKRRPQIHAKNRTTKGYTFTIALPAGISYRDFASKAEYFRDSVGGNKVNVSINQVGKMAILQISTNMLGDYFDYDANYIKKGILPIPIGYTILTHGNTGTIDGIPYIINSACKAISNSATAANEYAMAYGPLSNYKLVVFSDLDVQRSTDFKFSTGQIAHRGSIFAGGNVIAQNGFLRIKKVAAV